MIHFSRICEMWNGRNYFELQQFTLKEGLCILMEYFFSKYFYIELSFDG